MGGDDSQKLLPWRGICSSPGRKPPAHYEINTVAENCAMGNLPTPPSPDKARPGRGSATGGLGHFWQAYLGHYSRAPKPREQWTLFRDVHPGYVSWGQYEEN